jgi:hypothetical protein
MGAKKTWAITAPSLPRPALRPWPVLRTRVGKISAGVMKVVALGPRWVLGEEGDDAGSTSGLDDCTKLSGENSEYGREGRLTKVEEELRHDVED